MKPIVRGFYQLLIIPLAYLAYLPVNQFLILPWLGCGCSVPSEEKTGWFDAFNANDFTRVVSWAFIVLCIVLTFLHIKRFAQWWQKLLFAVVCTAVILLEGFFFYYGSLWR